MTISEVPGKPETEARQLLTEMDDLRVQLAQTSKSSQQPDLAILEKMESTSRRFRDVNEQMMADRTLPS